MALRRLRPRRVTLEDLAWLHTRASEYGFDGPRLHALVLELTGREHLVDLYDDECREVGMAMHAHWLAELPPRPPFDRQALSKQLWG